MTNYVRKYRELGVFTPNYRDQWVEIEWTKTYDIPF